MIDEKYYSIMCGDLLLGILKADEDTCKLFDEALGIQGYTLLNVTPERAQELFTEGFQLFKTMKGVK